MATADTASASLGPRYAPEDPTLPKPWKGLIDGSTGVQYYWNPETNVTQYERPASNAPPPLPLSTPPATSAAPDLAPSSFTPAAPQSIAVPVQHQYQPPMQMHQYPALQIAQQQQQTPHIQMQHMQYQQTLVAQRQPVQQGPMPVQQVKSFGITQNEQVALHQGKQGGHSSSQIRNGGIHSGQTPQVNLHSFSGKQSTGGFINSPENGSSITQLQGGGNDGMQRQQLGSRTALSHSGPSMVHNLQGGSLGLQMGYNQNQRAGNELLYNNNSTRHDEGRTMVQQQPLLAPIPRVQNQQDVRMPALHMQNGPPGHPLGMNVAAGNPMLNLYNQPSVRPSQNFSPNAPAWPSPRVAGSSDLLNPSASDAYRRQHEVTATGDNVPAPFMTFEATGFPPEILKEIHLAGFTSPTPIQAQTWPIALQSRDIVAIAKTGSGKTLGYIIPAFIHLRRSQYNPQMGPVVVVLAPTRELATQIQDEFVKFGRSSRISSACLYGGAPKGPQLREIERGVDIIVATPGRLNDILEMRKINFSQVSFLVLDEADRMLDMGFEPQIRKIVNEIPPRRQTLMYTATWPKEVRKIAGDLLVNPVQVNIGSVDVLEANKSITQYVEVVSPMEKQRRLEQILREQERGSKAIIFCSTKKLCDQLARSIGRNFGAAAIHGDKSQGERDWVLNQFRSGKAPILVATDVAARGLDIKDIRVVINYDFPTGVEDYVHRIGRTGRAGATGVAYTFFSEQDWKYAADLVKVLEGANQRVPPEVRDMAARGGQGYKDRSGMNRWDSNGGAPWESKGRGGMKDNGYGGGRGGGRDNRYGGRGGGRDNGYGGRGGGRDNGYGGRGGGRDNGFGGGRGSRNDFSGGRGIRGRGFGGPGGWGRNDRQDRLDGQGRYEYRRGGYRSRSRSPSRGRSRGYNRSRSSSRSRSRSRSWTRSRSRSWSRSRSRSRSRSGSRGPTRSHSHSDDRPERSAPQRTEMEPVQESHILPQPEVPRSLQSTADVYDGPPPVSQILPSTEDCRINSPLSSSDPVQKQSHEPMCRDLDPDEKLGTDP